MWEEYVKAASKKILGHALIYVSAELNFSEKNEKKKFSSPKSMD